jgi:hypothetical protein
VEPMGPSPSALMRCANAVSFVAVCAATLNAQRISATPKKPTQARPAPCWRHHREGKMAFENTTLTLPAATRAGPGGRRGCSCRLALFGATGSRFAPLARAAVTPQQKPRHLG